MAVKTPANLRPTIESDLVRLYFTLSSVANGDTTDVSAWGKSVLVVDAFPSTSAGVGGTISAGVITWAISAGTPNLIVGLTIA